MAEHGGPSLQGKTMPIPEAHWPLPRMPHGAWCLVLVVVKGLEGCHVEGGSQDTDPGRPSTCFSYTTILNYSQLRSAFPCLCPRVPLHMGDLCLYSVSSKKDLLGAFRQPETTVNLTDRGSKG